MVPGFVFPCKKSCGHPWQQTNGSSIKNYINISKICSLSPRVHSPSAFGKIFSHAPMFISNCRSVRKTFRFAAPTVRNSYYTKHYAIIISKLVSFLSSTTRIPHIAIPAPLTQACLTMLVLCAVQIF